MSDADHSAAPDGAAHDESLGQRLRALEAEREVLHRALRTQESLADRLSVAEHGAAQARREYEHARVVLMDAAAPPGRRWARAAARLARRAARRGVPVDLPSSALALHEEETPDAPSVAWSDSRYSEWIITHDTLDETQRERLIARLADLEDPPLISIVFPVFNTPEDYLRQALDSVLRQLYQNWELCIADDCSTEPHVAKVLDEYAERDHRVRVHYRETNGHISACSNAAVAMAAGPWLCLMDHDDVLADHALALSVLALAESPDAVILYSDEDHMDANGERLEPYFKPDFDPLLILGQNYFSHLCMIRADAVRQAGAFREGYEGSQDWDLVLRVLEGVTPEQVVHLPHVLYHWRVHAGSTASSVAAKPYVIDASRLVVQEHLNRTGVRASVTNLWGTSYNRVRWDLGREPPSVSVVMLPRSEAIFRSVDSLRVLTAYPAFELVVLDDGAFRPPLRQLLNERHGWLTVVANHDDLSDAGQRNLLARTVQSDVVCFVQDNVEVLDEEWLTELVGALSHPTVACAGPKLMYPDLRVQQAGIVVGIGGSVGYPHRLIADRFSAGYGGQLRLARCPSAVSWTCLAVRRDVFLEVGGFSDGGGGGIFGDVDLCLRLREAGWRTAFAPHAELLVHERPDDTRAATGSNAVHFDRDIRYLHQRWGPWVESDPSYNPNLSLAHESLSLAWPPRKPLG